MAIDIIDVANDRATGDVGLRLLRGGMDPRALRPYTGDDGRTYVDELVWEPKKQEYQERAKLVANAAAVLGFRQWIAMDDVVIPTALSRLRVAADIIGQGLTYNVPGGLGTTIIQFQTATNAGTATISMDPVRQSDRDRPSYDIGGLPLPVIHEDFSFSLREILNSQRPGGQPLDTTMAANAAYNVATALEQLTLGVTSSYSYGGYTVYGLTNHPSRLTKVLTLPTAGTWTPQGLLNDVLSGIQDLENNKFFGPYGIYFSKGWGQYLNNFWSGAFQSGNVASVLRGVDNVKWVRTSDLLTDYQMVIAQLTPDVVRMVRGMPLTTVEWETHGGLQRNYKVMLMDVPQVRVNASGNLGVLHGTAA